MLTVDLLIFIYIDRFSALNVVMTHKLFSEQVSVGRSAYTPNNAQDLGGGVEKWDGIFQSIRPGQTQLFANIDVASAAFIKGGNAASLMAEIKRVRHLDELRRPNAITSRDFQTFHKHFKTCSFTVTHRGGNFKKRYAPYGKMRGDQFNKTFGVFRTITDQLLTCVCV